MSPKSESLWENSDNFVNIHNQIVKNRSALKSECKDLSDQIDDNFWFVFLTFEKIIFFRWKEDMSNSTTVKTNNSVTICGVYPFRHVQLCTPICRNPAEFTTTFDLDCVCVYFDGKNVYGTDRYVRSVNTLTNFIPLKDISDRPRSARMIKYSLRGYDTVLYESCRHYPR